MMDSEVQSSRIMSIASVKAGLGCKSYGKALDFSGSQDHSLQPETLAAITLCPPSISGVFVRSPKLLVSGKAFGRLKDIWYTHNPKSGSTHVQCCCAGCNTFSPRPLSGHALFFFPVSGVQKAMHFLHCPTLRSLGSYFSFQFNICYPQAF